MEARRQAGCFVLGSAGARPNGGSERPGAAPIPGAVRGSLVATALAAFLSTRDVEPGTWLLFLPLTIAWCIAMDLRFGVSRRLSRRRDRREGR